MKNLLLIFSVLLSASISSGEAFSKESTSIRIKDSTIKDQKKSNSLEFRETISFTCTFDKYSNLEGHFQNNEYLFPPFLITYTIGDTLATFTGNVGDIKVAAHIGEDSISFIQLDPIVATTTICKKTLKVVHSRHFLIGGAFIPTQYYGTALVKYLNN